MNQQYLFYVSYYAELMNDSGKKPADINTINDCILKASYQSGSLMPFSVDGAKDLEGWTTYCFPMKVRYPGLLAGLGYQHEAGKYSPDKTQEIKLGFSLDYVSGLPYIPGSTLKGVLRSAFSKYDTDIGMLLGVDSKVVHALEDAIFEEGQDIFLDVFPVKGDNDGRLLGLEYITSHKAPPIEKSESKTSESMTPDSKALDLNYDGLTTINPLRLLKIRPEVTILVRFLLKDTCVTVEEKCYELTSAIKKELFGIILERYGVGAKTNTGYGHVIRDHELEHPGESYRWLIVEPEQDKATKTSKKAWK